MGTAAFQITWRKIAFVLLQLPEKIGLFSGSPKGAKASAGIYTLIKTAKANGLSPIKYIQFILGDIPGTLFLEYPEYLEEYMPWIC